MDKNPPASAGDTGSIPRLGRFHMPWSNWAHAPQLLLSLRSRAYKAQLPSPRAAATGSCAPRACALRQQEPLQWEAHAQQLESSLHSQQLEKAQAKQQRPNTAKKTHKNWQDVAKAVLKGKINSTKQFNLN